MADASLTTPDDRQTSAGHTPGPWTNNVHSTYVYGANGNVCACGDPKASRTVGYTPCDIGTDALHEAVANARLIAAAPDMLAALEPFARLLDMYEGALAGGDVTDWTDYIDQVAWPSESDCRAARSALSRAKGERT